jgi:hypothetical protein
MERDASDLNSVHPGGSAPAMKIALVLVLVSLSGFDVNAQALPSGLPRALLIYDGDLKEARIKSEQTMPQWLSKCDPPFYEVFSIRTTPTARVLLAVFIGGNAREEVITYTLIPETVKSCATIGSLDSYTFRRSAKMQKGEYSDIFPILNARNEVRYLLHEEKSLSSVQGSASLARALLSLTATSLTRAARTIKTDVDPAQSVDAAIPFATLLK